jgi:hypothetical protein
MRLNAILILKWGLMNMRQISEVKENKFLVNEFARNTAQDHIDYLSG